MGRTRRRATGDPHARRHRSDSGRGRPRPHRERACRRSGRQLLGRRRVAQAWRGPTPGSGSASTITARAATMRSRPTRRRGSRPTCTSAASPRVRSRLGPGSGAGRRSCGSSAGATSTPSFSMPGRGRRWTTCDPAAIAGSTHRTRFEAWKEGLTGYPLVDAGMRQLRREGWMHNRARMVAASFLVKHLGDRLARRRAPFLRPPRSTAMSHRTSATGSGSRAPASIRRPNRVYNPTAQLRKLDPEGAYVRRYVPELAGVPARRHRRARPARTRISAADRGP